MSYRAAAGALLLGLLLLQAGTSRGAAPTPPPAAQEAWAERIESLERSRQEAERDALIRREVDAAWERQRTPLRERMEKTAAETWERYRPALEKELRRSVREDADKAAERAEMLLSQGSAYIGALQWGAAVLAVFGILITAFGVIITSMTVRTEKRVSQQSEKHLAEIRKCAEQAEDGLKDIQRCKAQMSAPPTPEGVPAPKTIKSAEKIVVTDEARTVRRADAQMAYARKNWRQALELWRNVLRYEPEAGDALFYAGTAALRAADEAPAGPERARLREIAEKMYGDAARIDPKSRVLWNNRGALLTEMGKTARDEGHGAACDAFWDRADDCYRKAAALRPDYAEAWSNRGNLLAHRGRAARDEGDGAARDAFWDRADDCFRKAAALRPDYAEAWYNRANLLMDRGRAAQDEGHGAACDAFWDRADDCYRKATDIRSELFQAWSNWSSLLLHRAAAAPEDQKPAYWRKCGKLLEKTASLSRTEALYNMACLAGQQGRARDCLRLLEEAHAAGSLPPLRHLERDADLDGVRDTEAFRALVETLRRKGA